MGDAHSCGRGQDGGVIEPPIPLLWAKLRPPMLTGQTIPRARLIDQLALADAPLTAIVAPAGYGKTTAAVQLAHRRSHRIAWVSLEPSDSDPARFWTYVGAALAAAGVPGADASWHLLGSGPTGTEEIALALRSAVEQCPEPVTLVLDDMHVIDSAEIEEGFAGWLRHPISNLRIVCTSRHDLPLPVGRLRSHGHLAEARLDALSFDAQETAALLADAFGVGQLRPEQIEALTRRTEGWPAGLQLAGLGLRDAADPDEHLARFTGDTRHLSEYLAVEAMSGLDDDMRAFLLATCVVTVLSADICDQLTGEIGSLRVLRQLVAANVFTSALDENATVFTYHPLFREHLRSALLADHPEQVPELHRRAAAWFVGQGAIDEAISHLCDAGDLADAERMLVDHSMLYSNAGHFQTISAWVSRIEKLPVLRIETCLLMAWIALNLRWHDQIDGWLERAAQSAASELERFVVATQTASIRAHRARHLGDVGMLVEHANQGVQMARSREANALPEDDDQASVLLRREAGYGAALSVSGSAAFWSGDPGSCMDQMRESILIARSTGMTLEVVFCLLYLAAAASDLGDHDAALAYADQALGMIEPGAERHHQPTLAHLARSVALANTGRPADAATALDEARRIATIRPEPLADVLIELQQARLHHRSGDQEAARAALRSAQALAESLPDAQMDVRLKAMENEIRFVARDVENLPVGARELTDREQAVLVLLPHKLSRRELAAQLVVSENTVKTHLTSIRHKLGVTGRASIVDRARELGLLD